MWKWVTLQVYFTQWFSATQEVHLMYYEATIEQEMRKFYNTLSEKDKRRYAAVEER
jgi:hypothetical protein